MGLGQIAVASGRVDSNRPVGSHPQGITGHRRVIPHRIALPDETITSEGLLARQPGPPRGHGTPAIGMAVSEDGRGPSDRSVSSEPDGRRPAPPLAGGLEVEYFVVAGQDPTPVGYRNRPLAIREYRPPVARPIHLVTPHGNDPRGEPLGEHQPVPIG